MLARVFALLPLALLVSASHLEARDQCTTGAINCCNSSQSVEDASGCLTTLGLLEQAQNAGGVVGMTCSPPTVVGTGSGCNAQQQPLCCSNNDFNGLVNIGCTPINLNLRF